MQLSQTEGNSIRKWKVKVGMVYGLAWLDSKEINTASIRRWRSEPKEEEESSDGGRWVTNSILISDNYTHTHIYPLDLST